MADISSRKAQSQTRQNFSYRTVKSLRTGRSCGKIDAAVFKQFWNLSGLSLGHNQLEIIYERQKMITWRNWIYIETDLTPTVKMNEPFSSTALVTGSLWKTQKTVMCMLSFGKGINSSEFAS